MKHRGDNAPANAFTLEEQPKRPGYVLARFYENVQPFEETRGDLTISGYEYDEYYLELEYHEGLQDEILNSFDSFFAEAKAASTEPVTLESRVDAVEQETAQLAETVTALAGGGSDTEILNALLGVGGE